MQKDKVARGLARRAQTSAETLIPDMSYYTWGRALLGSSGYTTASTVAISTTYLPVKKGEEIRLLDNVNYKFKVGLFATTSASSKIIVTDWQTTTYIVPHDCYLKICLSNKDEVTEISYDKAVFVLHYIFGNYTTVIQTKIDINDHWGFVNNVLDLQTDNSLLFTWITDTHYMTQDTSQARLSLYIINKIRDFVNVSNALSTDFITHTGDIVNGYNGLSVHKNDLFDVMEVLRQSEAPVLLTEGNHDDNSWFASGEASTPAIGTLSDVVNTTDFYNRTIRHFNRDRFNFDKDNSTGGYYYIDFSNQKIRVIVVNSSDIPYTATDNVMDYYAQWTHGIRQQQMSWLANTALNFDEIGWGCNIFNPYEFC